MFTSLLVRRKQARCQEAMKLKASDASAITVRQNAGDKTGGDRGKRRNGKGVKDWRIF